MRERSRGTRQHHEYERETRCTAQAIQSSGMYRCIKEAYDGHTEHHYNYFRSLTKREREQYYPENED